MSTQNPFQFFLITAPTLVNVPSSVIDSYSNFLKKQLNSTLYVISTDLPVPVTLTAIEARQEYITLIGKLADNTDNSHYYFRTAIAAHRLAYFLKATSIPVEDSVVYKHYEHLKSITSNKKPESIVYFISAAAIDEAAASIVNAYDKHAYECFNSKIAEIYVSADRHYSAAAVNALLDYTKQLDGYIATGEVQYLSNMAHTAHNFAWLAGFTTMLVEDSVVSDAYTPVFLEPENKSELVNMVSSALKKVKDGLSSEFIGGGRVAMYGKIVPKKYSQLEPKAITRTTFKDCIDKRVEDLTAIQIHLNTFAADLTSLFGTVFTASIELENDLRYGFYITTDTGTTVFSGCILESFDGVELYNSTTDDGATIMMSPNFVTDFYSIAMNHTQCVGMVEALRSK